MSAALNYVIDQMAISPGGEVTSYAFWTWACSN